MSIQELDSNEMLAQLNELAQKHGVSKVNIGNWEALPKDQIVGSPPSSACLVCTGQGVELWHDGPIEVPADVEVVLHELAHHVLGFGDDGVCYALALSWSLEFPSHVAERVVAMYHG